MDERKKQLARIRQMERRFRAVTAAMKRLNAALDKWEAVQDDIAALSGYYGSQEWGSQEWRKDFEDDEAGLLPEDLKRGVLSEDGLWNLLDSCKELRIE